MYSGYDIDDLRVEKIAGSANIASEKLLEKVHYQPDAGIRHDSTPSTPGTQP